MGSLAQPWLKSWLCPLLGQPSFEEARQGKGHTFVKAACALCKLFRVFLSFPKEQHSASNTSPQLPGHGAGVREFPQVMDGALVTAHHLS